MIKPAQLCLFCYLAIGLLHYCRRVVQIVSVVSLVLVIAWCWCNHYEGRGMIWYGRYYHTSVSNVNSKAKGAQGSTQHSATLTIPYHR